MYEEWNGIDYGPYAVSNFGRVMNLETEVVRKPSIGRNGIRLVNLAWNGHQKIFVIPRLVAENFIEPPERPSYDSIIHVDGERSNCRAENLMWRPKWYAVEYHKQFEQPSRRVLARNGYIEALETGERFFHTHDLAQRYGIVARYAIDRALDHQQTRKVLPEMPLQRDSFAKVTFMAHFD